MRWGNSVDTVVGVVVVADEVGIVDAVEFTAGPGGSDQHDRRISTTGGWRRNGVCLVGA